jgi:hypothetical protein
MLRAILERFDMLDAKIDGALSKQSALESRVTAVETKVDPGNISAENPLRGPRPVGQHRCRTHPQRGNTWSSRSAEVIDCMK